MSSSLLLFPNVSADMSSSLLQVFVELGNLHGTSSFIYSTRVVCSDSISNIRVQVLSIPVLLLNCSQDWTCNLQMIVQQDTWRSGYRRWFPKEGGCRFNLDCRRVTIQEYLTLVPGYGKRNQKRQPPWI